MSHEPSQNWYALYAEGAALRLSAVALFFFVGGFLFIVLLPAGELWVTEVVLAGTGLFMLASLILALAAFLSGVRSRRLFRACVLAVAPILLSCIAALFVVWFR